MGEIMEGFVDAPDDKATLEATPDEEAPDTATPDEATWREEKFSLAWVTTGLASEVDKDESLLFDTMVGGVVDMSVSG